MMSESSADLLRRAAKVLRHRAEAATSGLWNADESDQRWGLPPHDDIADADANYIALVDPAVGLALADWLGSMLCGECPQGYHAEVREMKHALAVARAVLRET